MTKHTPGPWTADGEDSDWEINFNGISIAEVYDEADARLIAAAPDMLAALEAVEADYIKADLRVIVRAAIAKAKGAS